MASSIFEHNKSSQPILMISSSWFSPQFDKLMKFWLYYLNLKCHNHLDLEVLCSHILFFSKYFQIIDKSTWTTSDINCCPHCRACLRLKFPNMSGPSPDLAFLLRTCSMQLIWYRDKLSMPGFICTTKVSQVNSFQVFCCTNWNRLLWLSDMK